MAKLPEGESKMRIVGIVSLLVGIAIMGCSKSPAGLNEQEFLEIMGKAARAPHRFKEQDWPLLKNRTITYCGRIYNVSAMDYGSSVLLKLEKTHTGERIPWTLEGKTDSADFARSHKPEDPVCLTGIFESYQVRPDSGEFWGYVKLVSWEKSTAS
jgi:hypothetical protein